jgi:predicted NAD/FAD-binding protein
MLDPLRSPRWATIPGGAQRYVAALLARLRAAVRLSTPVTSVARTRGAIAVDGEPFDRAILATHADTALALLADATDEEHRLLGAFRYATHRVVLHGDPAFLPPTPGSWNSVRGVVTYSMNRLQGLRDAHYLVTLDPPREPRALLAETRMAHPQLDRAALAAQPALARLCHGGLAFAGAHLGFGFHEDAIRAGERAAALVQGTGIM